MNLLLFGPPGIGKGTQSALLVERRGLTHVSTGNILRAAIAAGTDLGRQAKAYMDAGRLVPGPVVRGAAEAHLRSLGTRNVVLDGYPRTVEQAEWLTEFFDAEGATLDAVVSLHGPADVIVERLSRRRCDPVTGMTYHLDAPPSDPTVFARLEQRSDDQPDVVRKRLEVYEAETAPVEAYYADRGAHYVVDGIGGVEEVYARIEAVLDAVEAAREA